MNYIARFDKRGKGTVDVAFESDVKAGTRMNKTDARCAMLREFGNDAIGWTLLKVRRA